jgi:hypothetical protein
LIEAYLEVNEMAEQMIVLQKELIKSKEELIAANNRIVNALKSRESKLAKVAAAELPSYDGEG